MPHRASHVAKATADPLGDIKPGRDELVGGRPQQPRELALGPEGVAGAHHEVGDELEGDGGGAHEDEQDEGEEDHQQPDLEPRGGAEALGRHSVDLDAEDVEHV